MGEQGLGAIVACAAMLLAAGAATVLYGRRALTLREGRRTWSLFTASCGSWATGTALWMATLVAGRPIAVPSLADAFHLAAVPLVLAAFLSIPAAPANRRQRVRALLDGCSLACSMTFVLWALVLGDAAEQASYGSLALAVTLTYPLVDVVLAAVMAVTMQVGADVRARLVGPQWAGGAAMAVANAAFAYHVLAGTFRLGTPWDLGWIVGYALLALTALRRLPATDGDLGAEPARLSDVGAWMGYAPLVIVLVTGLFEVVTSGSLDAVLTGIGLVMGLLVSTRQMLMINENSRLARDLERTIAELREREDLLHHRAHHDPLTELANRTLFSERLGKVLTESGAAVLFLDLDDFKRVNDSLGHAAGDGLLVAVAERLRNAVRTSDTVARLGGDEFAVLLPGVAEEAVARGQRLVEVLRAPFEVAGHAVPAAVSVGVAVGAQSSDPETLLRHADMAMYAAKAAGKGTVRVFEPAMEEQIRDEFELRADLGRAIDEGELRVHYQPLVDLQTGRVLGFEALARWDHPRRGLLPPAAFIAMAEESGSVVALGRRVLQEACAQLAAWRADHPELAEAEMSVNLSPRQLADPGIVSDVQRALRDSGLPPSRLVLELTEGMLVQDDELAIERLRALKALGVRIAIDDFGTGYASLGYLRRFPFDVLKIDKSFVGDVADDAGEQAMAVAILQLSGNLGLETVAEGIERDDQAAYLRELGCKVAQGYWFSPPVPADEIPALLAARERQVVEVGEPAGPER